MLLLLLLGSKSHYTSKPEVNEKKEVGWLEGIEPSNVGITIRCVNHFAIATTISTTKVSRSEGVVCVSAQAILAKFSAILRYAAATQAAAFGK